MTSNNTQQTTQYPPNEAQERFDSKYITGNEIQKLLGVQRSTVTTANKQGRLPQPITIQGSGTFIWERELVEDYLCAWKTVLDARRGDSV